MKEDDGIIKYYELANEGMKLLGMDLNRSKNLNGYLQKAGFRSIQCVVKKVPIGAWAKACIPVVLQFVRTLYG